MFLDCRRSTIVALVAGVVLLSACAQPGSVASVPAQPKLNFLDVERFDTELSASMGAPLPKVEVAFYDRVTPSQLPERLQKWMAAVESRGGKVKVVEPPSALQTRSPMLLISAISSLWTANRTLQQASAEARFRVASDYDAEVLLRDDGKGGRVVDRIVFTRRGP